jgi:hypothetical protein
VALSVRARELDLMPRGYKNIQDIDAGVDRLVRCIKDAVAQHVPLSTPSSFPVSWWSSWLTQLVKNARGPGGGTSGVHMMGLGRRTLRHYVLKGKLSRKLRQQISRK